MNVDVLVGHYMAIVRHIREFWSTKYFPLGPTFFSGLLHNLPFFQIQGCRKQSQKDMLRLTIKITKYALNTYPGLQKVFWLVLDLWLENGLPFYPCTCICDKLFERGKNGNALPLLRTTLNIYLLCVY